MYGPNLRETIKNRLMEVMENTCSERYRFILKVFNVDTERLEGRIESTGTQSGSGGTAMFTDLRACARSVYLWLSVYLSPSLYVCLLVSLPLSFSRSLSVFLPRSPSLYSHLRVKWSFWQHSKEQCAFVFGK